MDPSLKEAKKKGGWCACVDHRPITPRSKLLSRWKVARRVTRHNIFHSILLPCIVRLSEARRRQKAEQRTKAFVSADALGCFDPPWTDRRRHAGM